MATSSSSLNNADLLVREADGTLQRFPLTSERAWREGLIISDAGCVMENGQYSFSLQTTLNVKPDTIRLFINGEEVARGIGSLDRIQNSSHAFEYPLQILPGITPFGLIVGFARAEVEYQTELGLQYESTEDIPVLTQGNPETEKERVDLMFSTLFDSDTDETITWMLSDTSAMDRRFSIIEGSSAAHSPRSFSTFLQLAERVLAGFEECLGSFRQRAASRVGRNVTRIGRNHVTQIGIRETLWIAHNPGALEQVGAKTSITDGKKSYLPRYIDTERRAKTYDIYENQIVMAFLDQAARQLLRLSALLDEHAEHERSVLRALSPYTKEGYVLSSLLVTSISARRRTQTQMALGSLSKKARRLRDAYLRAAPDVSPIPFRPPRRSKIFQEVDPYVKLFQLIQKWCAFGDLDIAKESLAVRTERMDTFYELYVLHELLSALHSAGFRPDDSIENPIAQVRYSNVGQYDASAKQVANLYCLKRNTTKLQLFYEPIFCADATEQNGVTLHRTTIGTNGPTAPYTPDYLIRVSRDGGVWQDFVFEAKYRYVIGVTKSVDRSFPIPGGTSIQTTEFINCLLKYKLGCIASDTGNAPQAVWLFCGRDAGSALQTFEASPWVSANHKSLYASGAASLSPKANMANTVLGILSLLDEEEGQVIQSIPDVSIETPAEEGPTTTAKTSKEKPRLEIGSESIAASLGSPEPQRQSAKTIRDTSDQTAELITSLYELLPNKATLYDSLWVRINIGINMPLLRDKRAKRYRQLTLDGKNVFYLAQVLPNDIRKLERAVRNYSENK